MSRLHFHPIKGQACQILRDILSMPEISSCCQDVLPVIRLACEEIVVNIASYAYPDEAEGFLDVEVVKTDRLVIRFEDGGIPFNPLEQNDPDTELPWNMRQIGGLGIFLTIRKMDAVNYAYEDGRNVLTIEKIIA